MDSGVKTALVTGASRGIGRAVAVRLAADGYAVVINYNESRAAAEELAGEIGASGGICRVIRADVSTRAGAERLFSEAGGVEVLVNNAGIAHFGLFTDMTDEEYSRIFDTNMRSCFLCSQLAAPYMINKKSGAIINISSMWGITGASCEAVYSASKAAVIGFTRALAAELGPSGIRANCIAPGVIDTDMNKRLTAEDNSEIKAATPLCRIGTPEEVASVVSFLASDAAGFVTGQVISPNGGFVMC